MKYKNISNNKVIIPSVTVVQPGETFEAPDDVVLTSAFLEPVVEKKESKPAPELLPNSNKT